jgi:hypothetical protein
LVGGERHRLDSIAVTRARIAYMQTRHLLILIEVRRSPRLLSERLILPRLSCYYNLLLPAINNSPEVLELFRGAPRPLARSEPLGPCDHCITGKVAEKFFFMMSEETPT